MKSVVQQLFLREFAPSDIVAVDHDAVDCRIVQQVGRYSFYITPGTVAVADSVLHWGLASFGVFKGFVEGLGDRGAVVGVNGS